MSSSKINYTAVCGSDLHIYRGHESGLDAGTVMGHEFTGEVVEIGKAVTSLKKGDWVVSPFTTSCGHCYYCQIGLTCRCETGQLYGWVEKGHGLHGAQAEYIRVPLADSTLLAYDKHLKPELMLFAGDILSTGYFCADQADIRPNRSYVVLGCGPVGLMAIIGARELGAEAVYAVDSISERLQQAQAYGAIPLNFRDLDVVAYIRSQTEGRGADAVMEAVGSYEAGKLAFELIRPGGTISTVGVHTSDQPAFSPVDAYNKNITYKIGRAPARHYMERMMKLIASEKYDLRAIISHCLPLTEGVRAYEIFDQKKEGCLKVILEA